MLILEVRVNVLEVDIAELVILKQRSLLIDVNLLHILVLVNLKADLALLVELRDVRVTAVAIEYVFGQGVNGWSEALLSVLLLDIFEEVPDTKSFRKWCGDRPLAL